MGYLAIARKWRPSRFEDLVGQGHVVQTLKNAIQLGRVSHAYLFSGSRGIGKTSVARIFAKALRCPNAKDAVPCNECTECLAINDSRSVDVVEIDGASNNGVEAVRGIRENVAYSASAGFYKVYIIDEVHMLSLSAFNALLKTLEEPPKHVIFILATTEVQKIPLTVLGRCQRFEFRRLTQVEIVGRLKEILASENVDIEEEGLRLIASHADGSLRDALSLLDQALSYASRNDGGAARLTEKQIVLALGVSETSAVTDFLRSILDQDIGRVIGLIGENYLAGVDLKHFAERCLEELRLLYLVTLARDAKDSGLTAEALDISATRFAALGEMTKTASLLQLERMAQVLSKAITQLGWSSLPRFVLEMAAVRMSKLDALSQVEAALAQGGAMSGTISIDKGDSAPAQPQPVAPPPPVATPKPPIQSAPRPSGAARVAERPPTPPSPVPQPEPSPYDDPGPSRPQFDKPPPPELDEPPPMGTLAPRVDRGGAQAQWEAFVDNVKRKNKPLLWALLCHATYRLETGPNGNKIVQMGFPEGSFFERQATEAKYRSDIEEHVKAFFGKETHFSLSTSKSNANKSIEEHKQAEAATLKKQALEDPTVQTIQKVLGAEVVNVDLEE